MPLKDWFRVLNIPQECLSKKSPRTGDMFSAWRILSVFNYKIDPMDLVKCDLVDPHLIECDHGLSERLKVDALYEYYVDSQQNELTEIRREAAMELPRYCHQHRTFFCQFYSLKITSSRIIQNFFQNGFMVQASFRVSHKLYFQEIKSRFSVLSAYTKFYKDTRSKGTQINH